MFAHRCHGELFILTDCQGSSHVLLHYPLSFSALSFCLDPNSCDSFSGNYVKIITLKNASQEFLLIST